MRRDPFSEYGSNDGVEWMRDPDGTVFWWDQSQKAWEIYGDARPGAASPPLEWEGSGIPLPQPSKGTPHPTVRYPMLRTLASLYSLMAWLIGVLGTIGVFVSVVRLGETGAAGIVSILVGLALVAVTVITMLAYSQGVRLMLDVESNTRRTAEALENTGE